MKSIVKVFATLSLATAVGEMIEKNESSIHFKIAGQALKRVGFTAVGRYPYPALSDQKVNQVGDSVTVLLSKSIETPFILSMLIAGLTDIRAKCNPDRWCLLDPVIDCAQTCLDFYPDDIDHNAAFEQYEKWTA